VVTFAEYLARHVSGRPVQLKAVLPFWEPPAPAATVKLTPLHQEVLDAIQGEMSTLELSAILGIKNEATRWRAYALCYKGLLEKVPDTHPQRWRRT